MNDIETPPKEILEGYQLLLCPIEPVRSGHINRTFRVRRGAETFVLQMLNPIFAPEVHLDIRAVTEWIAARGLVTPRLVPALCGADWLADPAGRTWRLLTHVPGQTLLAADSPGRCLEAGRLLGQFHRATWDCPHRFVFTRLGIHDTPRHLAALREALAQHRGHRLFGPISCLAEQILSAGESLEPVERLPARLVHGDPKISNFVFADNGRAVALIDLDTLGRMPLPVELGDALRSWCAPQGEDRGEPLRVDFFEAGVRGWREGIGDLPAPEEIRAIPAAVARIALELAARFAADALHERYFAYDRERYPAAGEHNRVRAESQWALYRSAIELRPRLDAVVEDLLAV
ncbi:MAG: aminoglycoside phosphotransferase family protein [Myxococcales bacterium]|nr:aminoglycoside phosphotransferase family protein [Myxococcales bacterium]